ncbi:MAG: YncE family protein [Acidobacteria bacterium]|nr:YncE family protein [Acidobacteriota bacterium]
MKKRRLSPLIAALMLTASSGPASAATLIALNKGEATASLIDAASGETRAVVETGAGPHEVAVSPDGKLAVVTNYGQKEPGSTLTVIDISGGKAAGTIDLGPHKRPHGIEFLPGGKEVAVTVEESDAVVLVDVPARKVTKTISTGQKLSHMLAVDSNGSRIYVANIRSGSVTALDVMTGESKSVATGDGAEGIGLTPDGKELWVTNRAADTISVLDPATLEKKRTLASASFPIRLRFTPDGKRALVSNARSGDVVFFDTASGKELNRVKMDFTSADPDGRLFGDRFGKSPVPIGILIPPSGKVAYVANANADLIAVIDLEKGAVTAAVKAGKEPDGLGWSPVSLSRPPAKPARTAP